jgi:2-octaprenyl-6-methoxyphenol hydroxylase
MRVDVAIAGAGPVGCTLALALAAGGRRVALIESRSRTALEAPAFRPIALSYASRLVLERVGAWESLQGSVIDSIHVSQAQGFGRMLMTAADAGLPELGRVVDYASLGKALFALTLKGIGECRLGNGIERVESGQRELSLLLADGERLAANCLVHAEGASEDMREKRYGQDALVAAVAADPPSGARAFERFTDQGPLALLPFAGRYAMVWAARPERISALADARDDEFLHALQEAFGRRAGRFIAVDSRARMPLTLRRRRVRVQGREVYAGNAAQTLHPVAGQGLNLGLRDAWTFARVAGTQPDPGDAGVLARYAALRKRDAFATAGITDLLATAFTHGVPFGAAMLALDACAPARRFFARRMVFGPSAIP